jgi:hypothetical protein
VRLLARSWKVSSRARRRERGRGEEPEVLTKPKSSKSSRSVITKQFSNPPAKQFNSTCIIISPLVTWTFSCPEVQMFFVFISFGCIRRGGIYLNGPVEK